MRELNTPNSEVPKTLIVAGYEEGFELENSTLLPRLLYCQFRIQYTASELVEKVTGKPLSHEPFMDYLRKKFQPLYGL